MGWNIPPVMGENGCRLVKEIHKAFSSGVRLLKFEKKYQVCIPASLEERGRVRNFGIEKMYGGGGN